MLTIIKKLTSESFRKKLTECKSVISWFLNGQVLPAPHIIKRTILRNYARKYECATFVETGTYLGDTTYALKNTFKKLISIELDQNLYNRAFERFKHNPHIIILQGDSATVLPSVIATVSSPALFWLDGHYSGENTGHSGLETPIMAELELIFNHPIKNHVILIDDARLFLGARDYPTLEEVRNFVKNNSAYLNMSVENDIIRITV